MIGKPRQNALASPVERTSRNTEIIALPKGNKDAATTRDSLISVFTELLTRSTASTG